MPVSSAEIRTIARDVLLRSLDMLSADDAISFVEQVEIKHSRVRRHRSRYFTNRCVDLCGRGLPIALLPLAFVARVAQFGLGDLGVGAELRPSLAVVIALFDDG